MMDDERRTTVGGWRMARTGGLTVGVEVMSRGASPVGKADALRSR
jgi:hypothetical protein